MKYEKVCVRIAGSIDQLPNILEAVHYLKYYLLFYSIENYYKIFPSFLDVIYVFIKKCDNYDVIGFDRKFDQYWSAKY